MAQGGPWAVFAGGAPAVTAEKIAATSATTTSRGVMSVCFTNSSLSPRRDRFRWSRARGRAGACVQHAALGDSGWPVSGDRRCSSSPRDGPSRRCATIAKGTVGHKHRTGLVEDGFGHAHGVLPCDRRGPLRTLLLLDEACWVEAGQQVFAGRA